MNVPSFTRDWRHLCATRTQADRRRYLKRASARRNRREARGEVEGYRAGTRPVSNWDVV